MEPFVVAAILAGLLLVGFLVWRRRRLGEVMGRAKAYNRYHELRSEAFNGGNERSAGFTVRANAIVDELGPMFDPRTSGWDRLTLLEPNLRDFVTGHIDPGGEERNDLEAFAETIIRLEVGKFRGITPPEWLEAARDFASDAATWRATEPPSGKGLDPESAFDEALAVARRLYSFGSRAWDRKRQAAFERW